MERGPETSSQMNRHLTDIKEQLELEGYVPGSPIYDFKLHERRVDLCKDLHRVGSCTECSYFDNCDLVKEFLRKAKYGSPQKD